MLYSCRLLRHDCVWIIGLLSLRLWRMRLVNKVDDSIGWRLSRYGVTWWRLPSYGIGCWRICTPVILLKWLLTDLLICHWVVFLFGGRNLALLLNLVIVAMYADIPSRNLDWTSWRRWRPYNGLRWHRSWRTYLSAQQ